MRLRLFVALVAIVSLLSLPFAASTNAGFILYPSAKMPYPTNLTTDIALTGGYLGENITICAGQAVPFNASFSTLWYTNYYDSALYSHALNYTQLVPFSASNQNQQIVWVSPANLTLLNTVNYADYPLASTPANNYLSSLVNASPLEKSKYREQPNNIITNPNNGNQYFKAQVGIICKGTQRLQSSYAPYGTAPAQYYGQAAAYPAINFTTPGTYSFYTVLAADSCSAVGRSFSPNGAGELVAVYKNYSASILNHTGPARTIIVLNNTPFNCSLAISNQTFSPFPNVTVGQAMNISFVLSNPGTAPLTITSISVPPALGPFTVTAPPLLPFTLAGGASIAINGVAHAPFAPCQNCQYTVLINSIAAATACSGASSCNASFAKNLSVQSPPNCSMVLSSPSFSPMPYPLPGQQLSFNFSIMNGANGNAEVQSIAFMQQNQFTNLSVISPAIPFNITPLSSSPVQASAVAGANGCNQFLAVKVMSEVSDPNTGYTTDCFANFTKNFTNASAFNCSMAISSLSFSTYSPSPGENISFNMTIANNGAAVAKVINIYPSAYLNGVQVLAFTNMTLSPQVPIYIAPGASQALSGWVIAPYLSGQYSLAVRAYSMATNGCSPAKYCEPAATRNFTLDSGVGCNLSIVDFTMPQGPHNTGTPVPFSVATQNNGAYPANLTYVNWNDWSVPYPQFSTQLPLGIAPGATGALQGYITTPLNNGNYTADMTLNYAVHNPATGGSAVCNQTIAQPFEVQFSHVNLSCRIDSGYCMTGNLVHPNTIFIREMNYYSPYPGVNHLLIQSNLVSNPAVNISVAGLSGVAIAQSLPAGSYQTPANTTDSTPWPQSGVVTVSCANESINCTPCVLPVDVWKIPDSCNVSFEPVRNPPNFLQTDSSAFNATCYNHGLRTVCPNYVSWYTGIANAAASPASSPTGYLVQGGFSTQNSPVSNGTLEGNVVCQIWWANLVNCRANVSVVASLPQNNSTAVSCSNNSIIGDANGDGNVNAVDALLISRIFVGNISMPENKCCVDVNNDSAVNGVDSLMVMKYFAQLPPWGNAGLQCWQIQPLPAPQAPPAPPQQQGAPDLIISSLSTQTGIVGKPSTVTIATGNQGTAAAGASVTSYYINGNLAGTISVPALASGSTSTAQVSVACRSQGTMVVSASANSNRAVAEANYGNGDKAVTMICNSPSLAKEAQGKDYFSASMADVYGGLMGRMAGFLRLLIAGSP